MDQLSITVSLDEPDTASMLAALSAVDTNTGAVVTFTGICRDEQGLLDALVLEHYPGMAETKLEDIAKEAMEKWPCQHMIVHHRHGAVKPGQVIVAVATASRHREAAFQAAHYMMDFLKTDAPFWKKEIWKGDRADSWVSAKSSDDDARQKWDGS